MTPTWRHLLDTARRALAGAKEVVVPTTQVRAMRGQPRVHFDQAALARLGESMQSIGQIYPGIVRAIPTNGIVRYELLDGERRWRAAKLKGLKYRALLVDVDDQAASFLIAAVANFNREAHTPLEVSDSVASMLKLGMPMNEIASVLGLGVQWVMQIHGLQKLTPAVRAMMDPTLPVRQILPVTAAVKISKADVSLQQELAERVISKQVSLQGLRGEVVRVSRAAGTPVRERTADPRNSWASLRARGIQMARVAQDLTTALADGDALRVYLTKRTPGEITAVCADLRAAANACHLLADRVESNSLARRRAS